MPRVFEWDIFISHASEDKESFVIALVKALEERGLAVWFDQFALTAGDSLRHKIDEGLSRSRFGVVVLSPSFFAKDWPRMELDGLLSRERYGRKVILPIWHRVTRDDVLRFSPILASRFAIDSVKGVEVVAEEIKRAAKVTSRSVSAGSEQEGPTSVLGTDSNPRPLDLSRDNDDLERFYETK